MGKLLRREIVPDRIRQLRKSRGFSLTDLSFEIYRLKSVKISVQSIHNWETGHVYPTQEHLTLLAEGLGVEESFFYK